MINLYEELKDATSIGISGHIRPDGDCVGSTMALYLYIKKNMPDKDVHIFLEKPADIFTCIKDIECVEDATAVSKKFDLFIALDCGEERLGDSVKFFKKAKRTINIDHHISNPGTGDVNYIDANASSASELVYNCLDATLIDKDVAQALYIGMIHDTGVFQYSNTSRHTLEVAGELISFGFDFTRIIEETFFEKTFKQTRLMGEALKNSYLMLDGKVSVSVLTLEVMNEYSASSYDTDGIVSNLRNIKGVDTAVFMYQFPSKDYKVSLRSNGVVDVAKVTEVFGGGGHKRAAGCTVSGDYHDIINNLVKEIALQYECR